MTDPLRAAVDAIAKQYTAHSEGDVDRISGVIRQRLERTHPQLVQGAANGMVGVHVNDHFRARDAQHRKQFYREESEGMVCQTWEGVLTEMPVIRDTHYPDHAHPEVIDRLEGLLNAHRTQRGGGPRIRITYGDAKSGRADTERTFETSGRVGRTTGQKKIPLMVNNARSYGGGPIDVANIVKIEHANKKLGGVIWKHPQYHEPLKVGDASAHGPQSAAEELLSRVCHGEDAGGVIEELTRPVLEGELSDDRSKELDRTKAKLRGKMFSYSDDKQDQAGRIIGKIKQRQSGRDYDRQRQLGDKKMRTWESAGARLIDSVRPHDRVTYLIHAGTGRNGPEYKEHTGRVVMVKPNGHDHLVVNGGGRHGTPHVVTHDTLLKVHTRKVAGPRPLPATAKRDPHGFTEARDTANELTCEHCGGRAKFSHGTAGKMHYGCTSPDCGKITSKRVLRSAGETADPYGSRFSIPWNRR